MPSKWSSRGAVNTLRHWGALVALAVLALTEFAAIRSGRNGRSSVNLLIEFHSLKPDNEIDHLCGFGCRE
jgi:hypothetical protein